MPTFGHRLSSQHLSSRMRRFLMAYRFVQVDSSELPRYLPPILGLVEAERARLGGTIVPQIPEFYGRYQGPGGATVVALDGEELVGFGLLALPERLNAIWSPHIARLGLDPRRSGGLVQCLVDPGHRRRGLGDALVAARVAASCEHGLQGLFATVAPENRPMLRLMERWGFQVIEVATVYEEQVRRVLMHRASGSERPSPERGAQAPVDPDRTPQAQPA